MKISVIVTSYNHEKYIKQCIESILMQKGDFELEIIIGDDFSKDNTTKILKYYEKEYSDIICLLPSKKNMGVTKNLKRCLKKVKGEYVAICEGDDYWTDIYKLDKQSKFLKEKKDYALCFNSFLMYYENQDKKNYVFQEKLTKKTYTTKDLILENFIGNFSCCMYKKDIIKKLPDDLYDIFTVDWMFNIACSEHGKIGFIKDTMSVYRIHENGLWSGKKSSKKYVEMLELIDIYNKFFSYKYNAEFEEHKKLLKMNFNKFKQSQLTQKPSTDNKLIEKGSNGKLNYMFKNKKRFVNTLRSLIKKISSYNNPDLIILDDLFPHPLSAFRLQEFNSYLEYFKKTEIYTNPLSFPALNEKRSIETIIKNYEDKYPQFKGKVKKFYPEKDLKGKIAYMIFLNNAYTYIDILEKYKIPFVFTLYPGGGFQLYQEVSDKKLKRIFSSPCFRKVIVTQKITYDYLIDNNLCQERDVVEIFGIVTPLNLIKKVSKDKKFYGRDKKNLNICFVAHRYSEKGVDKGYDTFIKVAHLLAGKYDNIYFFVVGNFDENIFDVQSIKHRIKFYGAREPEWFENFYKDKDIILSPNMPFNLMEGYFDGFPTGSCTEASLHKVAIFCTDELGLNTKFSSEEIVIVPPDAKEIVKIIEKYYHDPKKLEEIAKKGCEKVKEIYNYKNQIEPRINILKELMGDH